MKWCAFHSLLLFQGLVLGLHSVEAENQDSSSKSGLEDSQLVPNITRPSSPDGLQTNTLTTDVTQNGMPSFEEQIQSLFEEQRNASTGNPSNGPGVNDTNSLEVEECAGFKVTLPVRVLLGEKDALSIADAVITRRLPVLINGTGMSFYSVDFHYNKSLIFYSANNSIYSAKIVDGNKAIGSKVIVDKGVDAPVRLAVDWVHDKIYWISDTNRAIEAADLDGKNRQPIFSNISLTAYPANIAVDPYNNVAFFVSSSKIFKIELNETDHTYKELNIDHLEKEKIEVRTLALDRVNGRIYISGRVKRNTSSERLTVCLAHTDYNGNNWVELYKKTNWDEWSDIYSIDVFNNTLYFAHYEHRNNTADTLMKIGLSESQFNPTPLFVPEYRESGIWSIRTFHPCVQTPSDDPRCRKMS